jgi:uncharacterized protein (TIGR03067 family)
MKSKIMGRITSISILAFILCGLSVKNATGVFDKLNGTWIPVKQEMGGVLLPKTVFDNQKLIINDSTYIVSAESVDKGIVRIDSERMDIYSKEGVNNGKHFTATFKFENDEFIICYNLSGDQYPESFETKGKKNVLPFGF